MNLLKFQIRNKAVFHAKISTFCNIFSESLLNMNTRIIRTLRHVPLVSVLTGFHCNFITSTCLKMVFLQIYVKAGVHCRDAGTSS